MRDYVERHAIADGMAGLHAAVELLRTEYEALPDDTDPVHMALAGGYFNAYLLVHEMLVTLEDMGIGH